MVCSSSSNSCYDGKYAYVPALEDVLVWDVKKGVQVRVYPLEEVKILIQLLGRNVARDGIQI